MSFGIIESNQMLSILDEGITVLDNVTSINGVGAGITITSLGSEAIFTIPGSASFSLTTETPSGVVDGTNTIFTVAHNPQFVALNGLIQTANGIDFTLSGSGPYTLTFVNPPPLAQDPYTTILRSYY